MYWKSHNLCTSYCSDIYKNIVNFSSSPVMSFEFRLYSQQDEARYTGEESRGFLLRLHPILCGIIRYLLWSLDGAVRLNRQLSLI